jgi:BatD DUF11 like domain
MENWRWRVLFLHFAFCILHSASANELTVDRTTMNADDTLSIVVSLDGSFTSIDSVNIPVQNLRIVGGASVSSQMSWINGTLTQRKTFQYQARPIGSGSALVGPVVLETRDGQRETLAPIPVQILPDLAAGTNDPERILRELLATHRDPFFVVAEVDRTTAYLGEEIVVTWTLYNGTSVEGWELSNVPKREDFWSEQLEIRSERPETVMFGQFPMQKMVILRLALFPLRSGAVTIAPLEVRAEVMRQVDTGSPFGMFEGNVIGITRHSAPITIDVQPIAPGPPVDVVGDVAMNCGKAVQANGGPVVVDVALSGRANLRTAAPPHWASALDGSTQIEEGKLNVVRSSDAATMTRHWKLLVFPSHAGRFTLPPLAMRLFSPAGGRQELRCDAVTLQVTEAAAPKASGARTARPHSADGTSAPLIAVAALALIAVIVLIPRIRRASALKKRVREIARPPEEIRAKLHALLAAHELDEAALLREQSDRGDAYRSLHSRLDFDGSQEEVEFRLRDFLQLLK